MTCVLVCGGRDYADWLRLEEVLDTLAQVTGLPPISMVVTGDASGADSMAATWARRRKKAYAVFEADWAVHGKSAGPRRNQRMLDEGKPDIVVAFPGGRGTADMTRRARRAVVRVMVVSP